MAVLTHVWIQSTRDVDDMRQTIASVPQGSRVMVIMAIPKDNPEYWAAMPASRMIDGYYPTFYHLPALLVSERQSFWPLLFSSPYKQPIRVLPPYKRVAMDEGVPPSFKVLYLSDTSKSPYEYAPYTKYWQEDFDYVLVLQAAAMHDPKRFLA